MAEADVTILGICGSLRPDSHTLKALDLVLAAAAGPGVEVSKLHGAPLRLALCDGRHPSEAPPEVAAFLAAVAAARVVVLATPDYCGSFSGVLKNALDWLAPAGLAGKVAGLLSVAGGPSAEGSLLALRELCLRQAAWVVPLPAAVPLSNEVFGKPEAPFSRSIAEQLRALGEALPVAARLLAGWVADTAEVRYQM
jgi:NAD(P)H-dependent FMN reductase